MMDEREANQAEDQIIADADLEMAAGGNGGKGGNGGDGRIMGEEFPEGAAGNGGAGNSWGTS